MARRQHRVKRAGQAAVRALARRWPEGRSKAAARAALMRSRGALPRELVVNPSDVVIQVGTPQTRTIERLAALVGPAGRVLVVEADQGNQDEIRRCIASNRLDNVTLVAKGAWSGAGVMRFLVSSRPGDHRLDNQDISHDNDERTDAYVDSREIEVDTVDHICEQAGIRGPVGYVEVAVNGAELEVLAGMTEVLGRTSRIFVKGHPRHRDSGAPINREIARVLDASGFRTVIGSSTITISERWGRRDGDVFAWRPGR